MTWDYWYKFFSIALSGNEMILGLVCWCEGSCPLRVCLEFFSWWLVQGVCWWFELLSLVALLSVLNGFNNFVMSFCLCVSNFAWTWNEVLKIFTLSWSLEDQSLVSWEVWGFWVVLEWDARSVCEFKLIMMVFYFWMQLDVRCVWVDGVNKGFKFLRCKGKFLFWEWCAHWVVKLF